MHDHLDLSIIAKVCQHRLQESDQHDPLQLFLSWHEMSHGSQIWPLPISNKQGCSPTASLPHHIDRSLVRNLKYKREGRRAT